MNEKSLPIAPSKLLADELERLEKESSKIMKAEAKYAAEQKQNETDVQIEGMEEFKELEELLATAIRLMRLITKKLERLGY